MYVWCFEIFLPFQISFGDKLQIVSLVHFVHLLGRISKFALVSVLDPSFFGVVKKVDFVSSGNECECVCMSVEPHTALLLNFFPLRFMYPFKFLLTALNFSKMLKYLLLSLLLLLLLLLWNYKHIYTHTVSSPGWVAVGKLQHYFSTWVIQKM